MELELHIKMNPHLFLRDPEQSEVGKSILSMSIDLIAELGFEAFTFKKVAQQIASTEATIYRYFENKHRLLTYIISWYWNWMEYQVIFENHKLEDSKDKIQNIIRLLTFQIDDEMNFTHINKKKLYQIVIAEGNKAYLTKKVDEDCKHLIFKPYADLCERISNVFLEYQPQYPFARNLASTLVETAHLQFFFAAHLPLLTNYKSGISGNSEQIFQYLNHLIFNSLA